MGTAGQDEVDELTVPRLKVPRGCAKFMGHAPVTAIRHYCTIAPCDLHADIQAGLEAARRRPVASSDEDAIDEQADPSP